MAIMDFFQRIASKTAKEVRAYLEKNGPDACTLIDVRQPEEYQAGHLPGARLIPVNELPDRAGELNPNKPVFVYCTAGVRSRAGAAILKRAGLREVYSMTGGLRAWQGFLAAGPPDAGMVLFVAAHSTKQVIALAWFLEDGMRLFYRHLMSLEGKSDASQLFQQLASAENHHEKALLQLYRQETGSEAGKEFPDELLGNRGDCTQLMEGGIVLADALAWATDKPLQEILELAMALEVNSYDRYLALRQQFSDESSREVFGLLAAEEKVHLKHLTDLFSKCLG